MSHRVGMIRAEANKKGHPGGCPSRGGGGYCLWQVIAERGPEHVVYAFGGDTVGAIAGNHRARPAFAQGVGVLHAQAHAAIVATVEVIPVAKGTFLDVFGLSAAASARVVPGGAPVVAGSRSGEAGGVAQVVGTVADCRGGGSSPVTAINTGGALTD